QVYQIIHMDCHGTEVIFLSQAHHLIALRSAYGIWRPLARARRKNLECATTQTIGTLGRIRRSTRARCMDADAPRRPRGWTPWRTPLKNVLLTRHGPGHAKSIATNRARWTNVSGRRTCKLLAKRWQ